MECFQEGDEELGKKRKDKERKDVSSGPARFDQIEDVLCGW